MIFFVK